MKKLNIISLFDGISNGQIALNNLTNNYQWFASEIDNNAINITQHNYPNTIQLGDINKIDIKTIYLSEIYNYICKKYFNNDLQSLQSIISEWELLHRINEEQSFVAYYTAQDEDEKQKISENTSLSINDRIWFFRNPVGDNGGIYDIIRSGEQRTKSNKSKFNKLFERSFWWNGYRQPKFRIEEESFGGTKRESCIRRNQKEIKGISHNSISNRRSEKSSKDKSVTTTSKSYNEGELLEINVKYRQKKINKKENGNRFQKENEIIFKTERILSTINENDTIKQDNRDSIWFYSKIQTTVVECEWGIIIFKGTYQMCVGGSPCTDFSKNGSKKGMVTSDNVEINNLNHYLNLKKNNTTFYGQSYLFWEYVRLLNELKPNYFILENVIMDKKWINIISNELNVLPIHINSKNFTAQNRDRLYWTNIPINLPIPNNNINLNQIIPNAIGGFGFRGKKINGKYVRISTTRKDGKANCITTAHNCSYVKLSDNSYRKLSINELESLQGIPINYVDNSKISNSVKLKLIGNSFTVDVINFLFLNLFQNHENKIQKSNQTTRMVV